MRTTAISTAAVLATLIVAAIGMGAWLFATEPGTAWLLGELRARAPVRVDVGELRGTIRSGLRLRDVLIEIGNDRIEIDDLSIDLDISNLLRRALVVDELTISTVTYTRGQPQPDAQPRTAFEMPIAVVVRDASVRRFAFVRADREDVLGPVSLHAEMAGRRLVLGDVVGSGLGFDVQGRGELEFGAALDMALEFGWVTTREEIRYVGEGRAEGAWPELEFHQDIQSPVAAVADGEFRLGASPDVDVEIGWRDLSWPGFTVARSPQGRARFTGWRDEYDFEGAGTIIVDGMASDSSASGSGTLEALDFDTLQLSGEFGEIAAVGRLNFTPLTWAFDVDATGVDPSARLPDWPGALNVTGRLAGSVMPMLEVSLRDAAIDGELRAQPVTATGVVVYRAPNRWRLENLDVSVAANRISLDGDLGETVDLDVAIDARRLDLLSPGATGALTASGRIGGTLSEPTVIGTLRGQALKYGELAAGAITASGEVVADQTQAIRLDIDAEALSIQGYMLDTASGTMTGTAMSHVAEIDVHSERGDALLAAEGAWRDGTWTGRVTALQLDEPTVGAWQLTEATRVMLDRDRVEVERACLAQSAAQLCGSVSYGTGSDALDIELTAFDLSALAPLMPDELSVTGRYDARLSLTGPLQRPAGSFTTRGTDTVIAIREVDEPALEVPVDVMEIQGDLSTDGQLTLTAGLQGRVGANVAVDATVTQLWDADREIRARISGEWADLAMLSLLSPDIGEVTGSASIDIEVEGPPRAPAVRGSAQLSDGRVVVPQWGLVLEQINATMSSPDGSRLLLQASGLAGEGRIDVTGVTEIDPAAGWPTELHVYGDRLQAVQRSDAEILLSPALEVHAALPDVNVTGAFLIPYGRLRLEELPPQAVRPSADTVVHGLDRRPERAHPLNVQADIRVGLGDDVRYTGAGLDVALSGAMGLVYESGRNAVASGAVKLSGEYQAYGQTLEIDEGQLLFTGPVGNPNLDVRATRHIESTTGGTQFGGAADTITVGVQLSGTVEAPVSRVFSEPSMSEADALSYLLLGRPLSASADAENATLESAALSMGLQQALPVIQRVGETLGLDEFSVQTTSTDAGELMAGKRISPRVYIRYTYGLFNRIGGLLMRFNLNERFSLETRSGDYRSMDLVYTVERD